VQDRYVGDVGDFGKFGLLRWLCGIEPPAKPMLRLGVVWYLVPEESKNDDGKHIAYLGEENAPVVRYECCDSNLYRQLGVLIRRTDRRVTKLMELGIFPGSTRHFAVPLSFQDVPWALRPFTRASWLQGAIDATEGCELVFIDPDNGLEILSTGPFRSRGPKFAFYDDLPPFLQRGQSLVIYQHVDRRGSAHVQAQRRMAEIRERLDVERVWTVQFLRGSRRLFFIVPARAHEEILHERTAQLLASPWHEENHFQPVLELS
jgi:hypothetical protein